MYNKFFVLKEPPFNITPDPKFIYLSKGHRKALDLLLYGIRERRGFILLTGEVGTGKTTLCKILLSMIDRRDKVGTALILNPLLSGYELLKAIVDDLGIKVKGDSFKPLVDALNRFLIKRTEEGGNVVLIIDEAQDLDIKTLEMIRLLSNLETDKHKLIQILLVGQPEIKNKLNLEELRPLRQRIVVQSQLNPLDLEDTKYYIFNRLAIAGGKGNIKFTPSSLQSIYENSRGIPRLINIVCDRVLMVAFIKEEKIITLDMVLEAIEDLNLDTEGYADLQGDEGFLRKAAHFPARLIKALNSV
ncbi:MAG: ExeA family protein [Thermodesulfobacteriota bacterium]